MKQSYLVVLSLLAGVFAFAARTVQITIPTGQSLQLANPSTSSVSYNIECFDHSGVPKANLTNQTLGPNATKLYGNTNRCAGGALPANSSSVSTVGLLECTGPTDFASAASRCDSFYSLCTYQQVGTHGFYSINGHYWFNINTSSWLFSVDYGSTFNSATPSTHAAATAGPGAYDKYCKVGTDQRDNCQHVAKTTSLAGALCCPGGTVSLCKVTVNSSSGFLSSPQFKGGSPF